jgi:hypothetical protein
MQFSVQYFFINFLLFRMEFGGMTKEQIKRMLQMRGVILPMISFSEKQKNKDLIFVPRVILYKKSAMKRKRSDCFQLKKNNHQSQISER